MARSEDEDLIGIVSRGCVISCLTDFLEGKTTVSLTFTDRQKALDFHHAILEKISRYRKWEQDFVDEKIFSICKVEVNNVILQCGCGRVFHSDRFGQNAYWNWDVNDIRPQCPHCGKQG